MGKAKVFPLVFALFGVAVALGKEKTEEMSTLVNTASWEPLFLNPLFLRTRTALCKPGKAVG